MPQVSDRFGPYPVTVVLDGAGNGQVSFQAVGNNIRITNGYAKCSTAVKQAVATAYKGTIIAAGSIVSSTQSGSTGSPFTGPFDLLDGETLTVRWEGGDAGATATATFTGKIIPFSDISGSEITWENIFAANDGTIIFPALQSTNYVAGVSGWKLNRNGDAEFQNVVVRGSFEADGPGGTRIKGYVTTVSTPTGLVVIPVIDFQASDLAMGPGSIYSYTDTPYSLLEMNSPTNGADTPSRISLRGSIVGDATTAVILDTSNVVVQDTGGLTGGLVLVGPDQGDLGRGMIAYAGDTSDSALVGNTLTSVLTTASTTFRKNRAYEVRLAGRLGPSAVSMAPGAVVVSSAGTTLHTYGRLSTPLVAEFAMLNSEAVFTVGAADLTRTVSLQLISNTAGQTVIQKARRWMTIWDVGPASKWPDAGVMV
jgi:hypothetical protein